MSHISDILNSKGFLNGLNKLQQCKFTDLQMCRFYQELEYSWGGSTTNRATLAC